MSTMAPPTEQPAGLREAKRRATAHALAQTAYDLALERGVDGFTIDDIVAGAGYSRRTFANHFSCKEEAIAGIALHRVQETMAAGPSDDEDVALLDWLMGMARVQLSGGLLPILRRLREAADASPGLEPYLMDVHRQIRGSALEAVRRRAGSGVPAVYPHILVGAVYGALMSMLDHGIELHLPDDSGAPPPGAVTLADFLDMTFDHLRAGF